MAMFKIVYLILLLLEICLCTVFEPKLIMDILKELKAPNSIVASTCWTSYEQLQYHSALANAKYDKIRMVQFFNRKRIPLEYIQDHQIIILFDLNCPSAVKDLSLVYSYHNGVQSPKRLILLCNETTDDLPKELLGIDLLIDIEALVIHHNGKEYIAYFIYKIGKNAEWRKEYYGNWNTSRKFQRVHDFIEVPAIRRSDLKGHEITICYVLTESDSINHLTDGVRDHIDTITKVNFPTTNQLLDFLNARKRFIFVDTWGYRSNNTWTGMTGYLVRGEVEIGGSPMFFTSERTSVVEYISSPTPTRSKFVFQQPKLSFENNLFLLSFKCTVWYCSIAMLFLLFWAMFVVAKWEQRKNTTFLDQILRRDDPGILRDNVMDIAILIFGAICQQGSPVELKGSLGRVVMLVLFLTLMFLYTSYSANIVALLQSSSSQIKTLDDLLKSSIKFGVHDTVFNRYYFTTATEPTRKAIYETKVAPPGAKPHFISMDEGVKRMREGLFAFHMETGVGYKFVGKYFDERQKCGLKEIQYLQVIDPWLAVKKNSSFKEMFKIGTKRIQEHGLQKRENQLLYAKRPKCSGREANFVSVSMADCSPALLVITYGTLISILVLLTEIVHHKKLKNLEALNVSKKFTLHSLSAYRVIHSKCFHEKQTRSKHISYANTIPPL